MTFIEHLRRNGLPVSRNGHAVVEGRRPAGFVHAPARELTGRRPELFLHSRLQDLERGAVTRERLSKPRDAPLGSAQQVVPPRLLAA